MKFGYFEKVDPETIFKERLSRLQQMLDSSDIAQCWISFIEGEFIFSEANAKFIEFVTRFSLQDYQLGINDFKEFIISLGLKNLDNFPIEIMQIPGCKLHIVKIDDNNFYMEIIDISGYLNEIAEVKSKFDELIKTMESFRSDTRHDLTTHVAVFQASIDLIDNYYLKGRFGLDKLKEILERCKSAIEDMEEYLNFHQPDEG